jgi:hypothetical protein
MTTIESTSQMIGREAAFTLDGEHVAAVTFRSRYRGRTSSPTATICAPRPDGPPITTDLTAP